MVSTLEIYTVEPDIDVQWSLVAWEKYVLIMLMLISICIQCISSHSVSMKMIHLSGTQSILTTKLQHGESPRIVKN